MCRNSIKKKHWKSKAVTQYRAQTHSPWIKGSIPLLTELVREPKELLPQFIMRTYKFFLGLLGMQDSRVCLIIFVLYYYCNVFCYFNEFLFILFWVYLVDGPSICRSNQKGWDAWWLSGWAVSFSSGSQNPGSSPTLSSLWRACFSLFLCHCLSLSLSVCVCVSHD